VTGVTGAGLSWKLIERTNVQPGTAEIWGAFSPLALSQVAVTATLSQSVASSITILSFKGADTVTGALGRGSGVSAPAATLTTTRNGSWVIGVGNDFSAALARTVDPGQVIVHQDLQSSTAATDTFWVQRTNAPSPLAGTVVTLGDTAPTTDACNLSICEVLPSLTTSPSVTLAWDAVPMTTDPNTNPTGYKLWLGLTSGSETPNANVGNVTTFKINLQSGTTYFAFVTAYNQANVNSAPSNEVTFTTP